MRIILLSTAILSASLGINNLFGDRFTYYPMVAHFWLYIGLAMRAVALHREQLRHGAAIAAGSRTPRGSRRAAPAPRRRACTPRAARC